jgi:hypothetical protein
MAALRGADGAFLLGEMAPHTTNGGQIYFLAGTPDPSGRGTTPRRDAVARIQKALPGFTVQKYLQQTHFSDDPTFKVQYSI